MNQRSLARRSIALLTIFLLFFIDTSTLPAFIVPLTDLMHVPAFAASTFVCLSEAKHDSNPRTLRRMAVCFGMMVAAASFIEMTQPIFGRSSSINDFGLSIAGVLLATCMALWLRNRRGRAEILAVLASIGLCLPFAFVGVVSSYQILSANERLPIVANTGSLIPDFRWVAGPQLSSSKAWRLARLEVAFLPGKTSIVMLKHPGQDWRGYSLLEIKCDNPSNEIVSLHIKVVFAATTSESSLLRSRTYLAKIPPGISRSSISLVDVDNLTLRQLANVHELRLFIRNNDKPRLLRLHSISLARPSNLEAHSSLEH